MLSGILPSQQQQQQQRRHRFYDFEDGPASTFNHKTSRLQNIYIDDNLI